MFLAAVMVCVFMFGAVAAHAQTDVPNYKDFSSGDRVGTWALNAFIFPGLGSYVVMQDWIGGSIMLGAGLAGSIFTIVGIYIYVQPILQADSYVMKDEYGNPRFDGESKMFDDDAMLRDMQKGITWLIVGGVVMLADQVFNIVRVSTYHKPLPKAAALLLDPDHWDIAVLPGKDGTGQVSLSYTIRY